MKRILKKYTIILCLLSVFILVLTSCQTSQSGNDTSKKTEEASMKPTPVKTSTPPASEAPTIKPTIEPTPTPVSTIKNTEPFTLTFIGHAAVKIKSKSGKVLYIDPAFSTGDYTEPADYILVTHGHDDHKPLDSVQRKDDHIKITTPEALIDGVYQTFDYGDFKIEAVPAGGNGNHAIGSGVGYIVTVDGVTVYHAGDTSMIEEMKQLTDRNLDYAMYPIDGIYNMNAKEATKVAELVGAKNNIPIHDFNEYNKRKQDNFTPKGRMELARGETIYLGETK